MPVRLVLNGVERTFPELSEGAKLADLVQTLALRADRVAIEHNGEIASRQQWSDTSLADGDRLEVVNFVGGGDSSANRRTP